MPLDHYLPANHIGSFSNDSNPKRRDRILAVADLKDGRLFSSPASKLCAENDFYTLTGGWENSRVLDQTWALYEADLSNAKDQLINKSLDAKTWLRVLVPFVTGILVRGKDFNLRFESRLLELGFDQSQINPNHGRFLEIQRLLASVLAAKWTVVTSTGNGCIVLNDIGFAPFYNVPTNEYGISIPLDLTHTLSIVPCRRRLVAIAVGDVWYPTINYANAEPNNHHGLNKILASTAHRFIFGPDREVISPLFAEKRSPSKVPEPVMMGFLGEPLARVHEFTWHRLTTMIEKSPKFPEPDASHIDWELLASKGWVPPVILPTNTPMFPSALHKRGDQISVNLYNI